MNDSWRRFFAFARREPLHAFVSLVAVLGAIWLLVVIAKAVVAMLIGLISGPVIILVFLLATMAVVMRFAIHGGRR